MHFVHHFRLYKSAFKRKKFIPFCGNGVDTYLPDTLTQTNLVVLLQKEVYRFDFFYYYLSGWPKESMEPSLTRIGEPFNFSFIQVCSKFRKFTLKNDNFVDKKWDPLDLQFQLAIRGKKFRMCWSLGISKIYCVYSRMRTGNV